MKAKHAATIRRGMLDAKKFTIEIIETSSTSEFKPLKTNLYGRAFRRTITKLKPLYHQYSYDMVLSDRQLYVWKSQH